ncbi:MAG: NAD(P)-binding protein [Pseudomonadota bacterium]
MPHVVVIGAEAGGLAAAVDLARQGVEVTVLETADIPRGKIRQHEAPCRRLQDRNHVIEGRNPSLEGPELGQHDQACRQGRVASTSALTQ